MMLLLLLPGVAKAELPAQALQILCLGDAEVCLIVVSETSSALFTGLREASVNEAIYM